MSAKNECSPVGGGCGDIFACLKAFDEHLKDTLEVRCDVTCERGERHTGGRHIARMGFTVCRPASWMPDHGYARNDDGEWFNVADSEHIQNVRWPSVNAQTGVLGVKA